MVFPRFKAVLFVHGCFWHRHGCKATTTPKSSKEFWLKKFNDNVTRDKRHIEELANQGWRIAIVWECALKGNNEQIDSVAIILREWLKSEAKFICLPTTEFVN